MYGASTEVSGHTLGSLLFLVQTKYTMIDVMLMYKAFLSSKSIT